MAIAKIVPRSGYLDIILFQLRRLLPRRAAQNFSMADVEVAWVVAFGVVL